MGPPARRTHLAGMGIGYQCLRGSAVWGFALLPPGWQNDLSASLVNGIGARKTGFGGRIKQAIGGQAADVGFAAGQHLGVAEAFAKLVGPLYKLFQLVVQDVIVADQVGGRGKWAKNPGCCSGRRTHRSPTPGWTHSF